MANGPQEDDGKDDCNGSAKLFANYESQFGPGDLGNAIDSACTAALASMAFYTGYVFLDVSERDVKQWCEERLKTKDDADDERRKDALKDVDVGEALQGSSEKSAGNTEYVESRNGEEQKHLATEAGLKLEEKTSKEAVVGAKERSDVGTRTEDNVNGKGDHAGDKNSVEEVVNDSVESFCRATCDEIEEGLVKVNISEDTEDRVKLTILDGREKSCRERRTNYLLESGKGGVRKRMSLTDGAGSSGVRRAVAQDEDVDGHDEDERWRSLRQGKVIGVGHEGAGSLNEGDERRGEERRRDIWRSFAKRGEVREAELEKGKGNNASEGSTHENLDDMYEQLIRRKLRIIDGSATQEERKKER